MASLKDIRRRIGSVKNTQQITKAMKMVAAAKLRRAQQAIVGAKPFAEKLEELTEKILEEVLAGAGAMNDAKQEAYLSSLHPLLKQNPEPNGSEEVKPKLALVVVTSDRGLCGAYNTNIIKFSVKRRKELLEKGYDVELFFTGKRGADFFTKRGMHGEAFGDFWHGRFTTDRAHKFARHFVHRYLTGEFAKVEVCFTEFKSAIAQVPTAKVMLPLSIHVDARSGGKKVSTSEEVAPSFIYKPSRQELLAQLLPKQIETQFYRCFADSLASEFGARMTAMDNATRNAKDMIARLSLEANRVRQASITKELMEIIGGAEALKG